MKFCVLVFIKAYSQSYNYLLFFVVEKYYERFSQIILLNLEEKIN